MQKLCPLMIKIVKEFPEEFKKIENELNAIKSDNPFQLIHETTRFIFFKFLNKEISSSLYQFLCNNQYIDIDLTIYWQREGYQNLCCLLCIYADDKKNEKVCICRVPKNKLVAQTFVECSVCKCTGCTG